MTPRVDRLLVARMDRVLTVEPAIRVHRLRNITDEVGHDAQRPAG